MIVNAWKRNISVFLLIAMMAVVGIGCGGSSDSTPGPADTRAPDPPTSLLAAAASDTEVNLNWTAATDNVGVTGYDVHRNGAKVNMVTVTGTTYSDTSCTASSTYSYTVTARDAAGNISAPSNSAFATTLAAGTGDLLPPTAPGSLSATATGSTSISLTWNASTDNVGVLGYNVYRSTTQAGAPVKVGTSAVTSYSDTGLTASTPYYYTVKAYDGAYNESLASNQAAATTASAGSTTLRVRVVSEENDSRLEGVTVVLGNSAGAFVSTARTDASGEVIFVNPPADATVTAAVISSNPGNPNWTEYSLKAVYDVNVTAFTIGLFAGSTATPDGTANVTVTDSLSSYEWTILPGWQWGQTGYNNPAAIDVYASDFQSDGRISFLALGFDLNFDPIGYGFALDKTFSKAMNVGIALNQTNFTQLTTTFTNTPPSADIINWIGIGMSRKGGPYVWLMDDSIPMPNPSVYDWLAIPGYGDRFNYEFEVALDANSNLAIDGYIGGLRESASLANQTVDFSTYPSVPTGVSVSGEGTARPTISWTGGDVNADAIFVEMESFDFVNGALHYYTINAPKTRTSIVFPELPASLASCRPTSWDFSANGLADIAVENDVLSGISTYDDYVKAYELWLNGSASITEVKWSGKFLKERSIAPTMPAAVNKPSAAGKAAKKKRGWWK